MQNCIYSIIMIMLEWTEGNGEIRQMLVSLTLVDEITAPLLSLWFFIIFLMFYTMSAWEYEHSPTPQWSFK